MKNILCSILFLATAQLQAQWKVTGGHVHISNTNTYLATSGEAQVTGGTLKNSGKFTCGNLTNEAAGTVRGVGLYYVRGSFSSSGSLLDANYFILEGTEPASISTNGTAVYNLKLDKSGAGANVPLNSDLAVSASLTLTGESKLLLGNHNLSMTSVSQSAAQPIGTSSTRFIVTDGTGMMIRPNLGATAYTFPVGASASGTWNRLLVTNTGTVDNIGVRCLPDALDGGSTGSPIATDAVAASWQISEALPGGSNLTVRSEWQTADELSNFERTNCAVRKWDGSEWDSAPLGAASGGGTGNNPYWRERAGFVSDGYFAVLDGAFVRPGANVRGDENLEIEIFPNPTSDRVFVNTNLETAQSLRIFDAQGRERLFLKTAETRGGIWLNVGQFGAGIFTVEVLGVGGERVFGRFSVLR